MENLAMINKPQFNKQFWLGKKVLVTGHTGFKGAWLAFWLARLGAQVTGVGLPPSTTPNLYSALKLSNRITSTFLDVRNYLAVKKTFEEVQPDVVFHLAAQALVNQSVKDPVGTISTNVVGTANILDATKTLGDSRVVIIATTDKVYKNKEWIWSYRENDELGGKDPYSASKAACELIIRSFDQSYFQNTATSVAAVRAGNVIGGGDWAENRIIPDAIRAWSRDKTLEIRNPSSVRPWQHVLEPLSSYLILAEHLWENPQSVKTLNIGPSDGIVLRVKDVIRLASKCYGNSEFIDCETDANIEARILTLNIEKAFQELGIRSLYRQPEAIEKTIIWYKKYYAGEDAELLCEADLRDYENRIDQISCAKNQFTWAGGD